MKKFITLVVLFFAGILFAGKMEEGREVPPQEFSIEFYKNLRGDYLVQHDRCYIKGERLVIVCKRHSGEVREFIAPLSSVSLNLIRSIEKITVLIKPVRNVETSVDEAVEVSCYGHRKGGVILLLYEEFRHLDKPEEPKEKKPEKKNPGPPGNAQDIGRQEFV